MLNFVAIYLATYLALNPFRSEGLVPGTEAIDLTARIPFLGLGLGRANYGFVFGLVAALLVYLFLWRTKRGFEIRAVGLSPGAASYAGMRIGVNTVLALAIGGSLAALGGGEEVLGVYGKMSIPFVQYVGFNGIGVCTWGVTTRRGSCSAPCSSAASPRAPRRCSSLPTCRCSQPP